MYICIYSSIIIYITTLYDVSLFVRKNLAEKIAYKQNSIHLYDHHYDRKNDEGSKRRIESLKKCIIYDLGVISLASLDDQAIYNELNRVSLLF